MLVFVALVFIKFSLHSLLLTPHISHDSETKLPSHLDLVSDGERIGALIHLQRPADRWRRNKPTSLNVPVSSKHNRGSGECVGEGLLRGEQDGGRRW